MCWRKDKGWDHIPAFSVSCITSQKAITFLKRLFPMAFVHYLIPRVCQTEQSLGWEYVASWLMEDGMVSS
jgi:hypothetical protein